MIEKIEQKLMEILVFAILILVSFSSNAISGQIEYCPPNTKEEAQRVLGIGETSDYKLSRFLNHIVRQGYNFEYKNRSYKLKCKTSVITDNMKNIMIYVGKNKENEYKMIYLIAADANNTIRYVAQFNQYKKQGYFE